MHIILKSYANVYTGGTFLGLEHDQTCRAKTYLTFLTLRIAPAIYCDTEAQGPC